MTLTLDARGVPVESVAVATSAAATYNRPRSPGFRKAPAMATPSVADSVTRLIRDLQAGRDSAAAPLLELYFDRLVQLARRRLHTLPGMASYEEDVALRSFHSLCRRMRD